MGRAHRRQDARLRPEEPRAADGAGAGRDRRQRVAGDLGAAGRGRLRPAHRLRQPRQPAARAGRNAAPRVRGAHGARRRRARTLLRQFIIEGTCCRSSAPRSASGLAVGGLRALLALYPESLPRSADVALDPDGARRSRSACRLLTGLVFGLAPLAHTRAAALAVALKEGGGRGATGGGRHGVRRALVVAEVALAVVLVVGAGLMVRTILNLSSVDAGFNRVAAVDVRPRPAQRQLPPPPPTGPGSTTAWSAELRAMPGVQSATAMQGLPPLRRRQRQRHRHRGLHRAQGRPVRERGLLPDGRRRLLRDDGHPDRRGPRLRRRPTTAARRWRSSTRRS